MDLFWQYTNSLTSISVALEMEPELEDVVVELTAESALVAVLPLLVHNLERNVLVRWSWKTNKQVLKGLYL